MRTFIRFLAIIAFMGAGLAFGAALTIYLSPPPPVQEPDVHIVRMLDVTIKDSNTTNRRQRFICKEAP